MQEGMSDEEFEDFKELISISGALSRRFAGQLYDEAKRAKEAEKRLEEECEKWRVLALKREKESIANLVLAGEWQSKAIKLEAEKAELDAMNKVLRDGGWESAQALIKLEAENAELKDSKGRLLALCKEFDNDIGKIQDENAELKKQLEDIAKKV